MSPELLDPDQFGPKDGRPTRESDRYALGMVIYEVLSGKVPFAPYRDYVVMRKVIEGERPERPQGEEGIRFTDDMWQTLQQCWTQEPEERPRLEVILGCLEPSDGPGPEIIVEALRTKFRSFVLRLGEQMEALIDGRKSVLSFLVSHSSGSYLWCAQRCATNSHPTSACVLTQPTQVSNSCEARCTSRAPARSQVFCLLQAGMRGEYLEQTHNNSSDSGQQDVRKVFTHRDPTPTQPASL